MKFIADSNTDEVLKAKVFELDEMKKAKEEKLLFLKKQVKNIFETADSERIKIWGQIVDRLKELGLVPAEVKSIDDSEFYFQLGDEKQIMQMKISDRGDSITDLLGKLLK